jgi:hypothetical protein
MSAICTATVSPSNCGHRHVTVGGVVLRLSDSDLQPLTAEELEQFYRFAVRHRGIALAELLNRVMVGDEATNVKQYQIIGPGVAVTKTNIGTAYTNILPGINGQRALLDFTGCTQFRIVLSANLVGTGAFGARIVRDSDTAVLFEAPALGAAGERELDSDWQAIPQGWDGLVYVRIQAKSATAADDPIFRACTVGLR